MRDDISALKDRDENTSQKDTQDRIAILFRHRYHCGHNTGKNSLKGQIKQKQFIQSKNTTRTFNVNPVHSNTQNSNKNNFNYIFFKLSNTRRRIFKNDSS